MVNMNLNDKTRVETQDGETFAIWQRRDEGPENDLVVLTQLDILTLARQAGFKVEVVPLEQPKPVRKSRWDGWQTQFERVPVQYGNLSKRERRVIHLALIG